MYGPLKALLLSLIRTAARKKSYCWMTTKVLSFHVGIAESTVKRFLDHLEDANAIYRRSYHYPGGMLRHLVPVELIDDYLEKMTSTKRLPNEVKKQIYLAWEKYQNA